MHLLSVQAGEIVSDEDAVDLGQDPADCLVLSLADSDLAGLARAYLSKQQQSESNDGPAFNMSLRLAGLQALRHNLSVDTYIENTVRASRLVIVRLLGGRSYWPYGLDRLLALTDDQGPLIAILPGDSRPDPALLQLSTLDLSIAERLWLYLSEGGTRNAEHFLDVVEALLNDQSLDLIPPPLPSPAAGLYWPKSQTQDLLTLTDLKEKWAQAGTQGIVPIVFYRSLLVSSDLAPIESLIDALISVGLSPLPIFVTSLKDPTSAALLRGLWAEISPAVCLNLTAFAAAAVGSDGTETPLADADCPVIQTILSGEAEPQWRSRSRGLSPRDLAMNVALPEVDGRLIGRAISFKAMPEPDPKLQYAAVCHRPIAERCLWTAQLAKAWATLKTTPAGERRVAILLANYPCRDGRLANGVGLDAPASLGEIIRAMRDAGYDFGQAPTDGAKLMDLIRAGPTNVPPSNLDEKGEPPRQGGVLWALSAYERKFRALPKNFQDAVCARWGAASEDPFCDQEGLHLAIHCFGACAICLQPGRGGHIDPEASYHDPELAPPHRYVATYLWLQQNMQAWVQLGKHGTLEWLPGKALALSETCAPDVLAGHMPYLYPFIVNDPGEGSQAKRRTQAVIIDHLTPPLTRAGSYGEMVKLETLMDEYALALGLDPTRANRLGEEIVALAQSSGIADDLRLSEIGPEATALAEIDSWLCELKELQIRDGLHIFGKAPEGRQRRDLLIALARLPRGNGTDGAASLLTALAHDLGLDFDPLNCAFGDQIPLPCPAILDEITKIDDQPIQPHWRTYGDAVERLEGLAALLVSNALPPDHSWKRSKAVLETIDSEIAPRVDMSAQQEIAGLLAGLDGRFVASGPSGAPTRGRLDTLPTGRNFYSVDSRAIPTRTAWEIGWHAATLLLERHFQDEGDWPKTLIMSAWGTANMRTGGDDIAQALALMGVRPQWEDTSGRIMGFEVIPLSALGRPRIDVTFRASGFFRDAFPAQMDLIDSAVRAVAALDEPEDSNPLAAEMRRSLGENLVGLADSPKAARVFSSQPGSYGSGLQILMDEDIWQNEADLAEAYGNWGGYAYGGEMSGREARADFRKRLSRAEVVLHTQDNREHDILDSDDYYQFQGGAALAVRHFSGHQPHIYHLDSSRPHRPKVGTLQDEISKIVRGRAANPKWIAGVMRHGYKGAFEIAATIDYLYAFAATSREVSHHHFQQLFDAWIATPTVRDFMEEANPDALKDTLKRFQDAIDRGLWQPQRNSTRDLLREEQKRLG